MTAGSIAMMAAMRIRHLVSFANGQVLPCAGTAAGALGLLHFAAGASHVVTDLTSQTLTLNVSSAAKKVPCPAQVFLAIVEAHATADPHVRTIGMCYFPRVNQNCILARMMPLSAVRNKASLLAEMDPSVLILLGIFVTLTRDVQMGAMKILMLALISAIH